MRTAQKSINRQQKARTISVSSPVGGLNARDPLAEMKPTDAVILDNMFCTPFNVEMRFGYSVWATGITGNVNTLASYSPPSGVTKLFAMAGGNAYNVSAIGAVGAAVFTGKTSDKWQYVNFGTPAGNFMYLVNGVDKPMLYDGTTWTAIDAASTPSITGVTTSLLVHVTAFKQRLWFTEVNSLRVWYLPTSSIAGAATSFDLSTLFNQGGYIVAMGDWSLDAGYGMDDYGVFVTSEGQVAVYKGTDPASATTWALIGVFDIGSPIGRRCLAKYAGDLTVISKDGLAPLSKALMSSRINSQEMLTDKVQHTMTDYTIGFGNNFGWQTINFPQESMLILNIPASATTSYQLVMNTISGAWSRWTNVNAFCWELNADLLYFGGNGIVYKMWDTQLDNTSSINFEALQAFNYFGNQSQLKQVKMIRPIISTDGSPALLLGVNMDYDMTAPVGTPSFTANNAALWDTAVWDVGTWGGSLQIKRDWQSAFGLGYSAAIHIVGSSKYAQLQWASTDYVIEQGGII